MLLQSHHWLLQPGLNNTTEDTHHQPTTSYLLQSHLRHIPHYGLNNRASAIYLQIYVYTLYIFTASPQEILLIAKYQILIYVCYNKICRFI